MAKADSSIEPRILECAKKEFLNCGYEKVSLKTICQNAGVTTGALYKRFSGKEALYCALISPIADELMERVKAENADNGSIEALGFHMDFVYKHIDTFRLLLKCCCDTPYSNYLNQLTDAIVTKLLRNMENNQHGGIVLDKRISPELLHIVVSAYISGFFELVRHNIDYEDAKKYEAQLSYLFKAGWSAISQ